MTGLLAPLLWLLAGGLLAAGLVPAARRDGAELGALAIGLGLALLAGLALLGLLPPLLLLALLLPVLVLAPAGLFLMHRRDGLPFLPPARSDADSPVPAPDPAARRARLLGALAVLALLLLAAALRLPNLGYSELQGDEARALLLAARLVQSQDPSTLLWHKKGPAELLLPAAAVKRGDLRESSARLPFALAGLGVVLAGFALGRRLWGTRAAFAAGLLLALDGYLVAFSRIVQYQSVVALCSVLAVWAAWRWYTSAAGGGVFLALSALFLGFGTWGHYEAAFAALPVGYLVASRGRAEGWPARAWARRLAPPLALGAGVTLAFYLPFVLHPQFAETLRYIAERRVGGGGPYNMLGDYFLRASFYNASYAVLLVLGGLVALLAAQLRLALGRFGRPAVVAWLLALVLVVARPGWLEVDGRSLAILAFLPMFAILLLSPRIEVAWRAVLWWFAGPFLVAGFLVQKPHTHFYTMVPAMALLLGWGLDRALTWAEGRWSPRLVRVAASLAALAFVAMAGWYLLTVFVRHDPEYKRVFPEARLPGYWLPYGEVPPRGGYFGFPYRAGWNEVRALFADGTLQGSYDSNEEPLITGWYTGGAVRCAGDPRYYLVAWRPQDEEEIPDREALERSHHLKATIRVDGREKLWVYDREPVQGEPLVIDDRGGLGSLGGPASSFLDRPLPVSQALELPLTQVHGLDPWGVFDERPAHMMAFGPELRLIGADFIGLGKDPADGSHLLPAGIRHLGIVTAWEPAAPLPADYRMALDLWRAPGVGREAAPVPGAAAAVADPAACGGPPSGEWAPGTRHFVAQELGLPAGLAPGDYWLRLRVGDEATIAAGGTLPASGTCGGCPVDVLAAFRVEPP